jgi:hypothetical protein
VCGGEDSQRGTCGSIQRAKLIAPFRITASLHLSVILLGVALRVNHERERASKRERERETVKRRGTARIRQLVLVRPLNYGPRHSDLPLYFTTLCIRQATQLQGARNMHLTWRNTLA